jgi:hypothetical protein
MNIKQFLCRLVLFGSAALPLLTVESLYSWYTKSYELTVNGNEVYFSITKSKVIKKVTLLIIGDSVGKQLYDNNTYNDDVYSLTCNQAISMAGYYFLLENFISRNRRKLPEKVILIAAPITFRNNLNQVYSYHYFLKPFYKPEYAKYFTTNCYKQIKKIPFYYTSQLPVILNSNWSPAYNDNNDPGIYRLISPVSNDYLARIRSLCSANNIMFNIYCPPLKTANRKQVAQLSTDTSEFEKCGLKQEFRAYFKNIKYLPDSLFVDNGHFKKKYIPVDYLGLDQSRIAMK